ncbi:MAG: ubiquinone/menaquinone biosynthesis methyltransferase [Ignavibacteria bacterium]|nr:ubiquinone/menaquinone biosynthesis methyltransferase [Ignavibacteria bacterium]
MSFTRDKEFIRKMFDEISPSYDRLNRILSGFQDRRWRKKAVDLLMSEVNDKPRILDLASGTGDLSIELLRLKPSEIYSADISEKMLGICRKKINYPSHKTVVADSSELPFEDNFFDVCAVSFGIRNFTDLNKSLSEILRVLKTGGRFLVTEFFRPLENNLTRRLFMFYFSNVLPFIGNKISGSSYAYDYLSDSVNNFLTVSDFCRITEDIGFTEIKIHKNFLDFVCTISCRKK